MSIETTPKADLDLERISADVFRDWPGHASTIFQRLRDTLNRLERSPLSSGIVDPPLVQFPGLRFCPMPRVGHHVVYYQPTDTGILIIRVLHGSRDTVPELERV